MSVDCSIQIWQACRSARLPRNVTDFLARQKLSVRVLRVVLANPKPVRTLLVQLVGTAKADQFFAPRARVREFARPRRVAGQKVSEVRRTAAQLWDEVIAEQNRKGIL
jgi:hypothetical protein